VRPPFVATVRNVEAKRIQNAAQPQYPSLSVRSSIVTLSTDRRLPSTKPALWQSLAHLCYYGGDVQMP
jgi:hypothetical protein